MRILICVADCELQSRERNLLIPLISKHRPSRSFLTTGEILAHSLLRFALPLSPEPVYPASGKPYFETGPRFSLSHSFLAGMCCISPAPVGADIERIRPVNMRAFSRFCSPDELASCSVFDLWVLKESLSKLTGEGLSALRRIRIKRLDQCLFSSDYSDVELKYFTCIPGYACAAAGIGAANAKIELITVEKILEFAGKLHYNKQA